MTQIVVVRSVSPAESGIALGLTIVLYALGNTVGGAVVHAHPRSALLCGLAGIGLRPVFGTVDMPALRWRRPASRATSARC